MCLYNKPLIFLLILFSLSTSSKSWSFWSSSPGRDIPENPSISKEIKGEFSIEALNDDKGIERVNNARRKLVISGSSKSCWYEAYQGLFAACSEIVADDNEKRKRFAWDLSNCFQKDSGRIPFPSCSVKSLMKDCLQKLDNDAIHTYRGFFLETNSICHHLQSDIFKRQTERLVNELKRSAEYAEEKLETIEEKSEKLIRGTESIENSLNSIDEKTQQVARTAAETIDHVAEISRQSEAVLERSERISATQTELQNGQEIIREKIEEGVATLNESYSNLDKEIENLLNETEKIEKEIARVGDTMASKMSVLQDKADDIGNIAGVSLEKQKELLEGQSQALGGLQLLTDFQSQALEESRLVVQKLVNFGHEQQEELLQRQEQLQRAHDHLVENSKSMLAAQETFERKQTSMFIALDKLFALHNALLLESRLIKAFFLYSISMFVLYLLTSTKQTYTVRHRLYIGLCATFLIEFTIIRYTTSSTIEQQMWLINLTRSLFVTLASAQILQAIFTYRDYEMLNYVMLKNLTEEVSNMRRKAELCWETESEVDWSSWVDTDIPDGIENLKDPDYVIRNEEEEIGDNSNVASSITSRYNLRSTRSLPQF